MNGRLVFLSFFRPRARLDTSSLVGLYAHEHVVVAAIVIPVESGPLGFPM
jgi:hypothetical protein